ncbi:tail fiber assembly protein [Enterobacter ludwigii]
MVSENNVTLDKEGLATSSGLLTVFNFDPKTGLYTGSSQEILAQGVGIPAHSTAEAPLAGVAGKVSVFRGGIWKQVADHRGEIVYCIVTGEPVEISQPGDYPADTTVLKPVTAFDVWNGEAWVTDEAAQQAAAVRAAKDEKSVRIAEANAFTQAWQTQLMLGIITDDDKALLTKWMQYIQAVQAINESDAPNIEWPAKPV